LDESTASLEEPRAELIDDKVVMMIPTASNHNRVVGNLNRIFSVYLYGKPCEPFGSGEEVHLTEKDCFIPDFMLVNDPDKVKAKYIQGAPELVVEILAPSTIRNDRICKKDAYAQNGVKEYWLIHPDDKSVEVYHSNGSELVLSDIYVLLPEEDLERMTEEQRAAVVTTFKCSLFDDLEISLDEIFYRVN